jgi:hypothetical protein
MRGWVYILSNESLPEMVKVGYTSKAPEGRAKELSGDTGVPTPFVVEYEVLIEDAHRCEQNVHRYLSDKRVNDNREFFRCSIDDAIKAVKTVAGDAVQFEKRLHETVPEDSVSYELIGLIRYLLEDGELTNHEVYHLCEWLNSNPESCDIWPGTELVQPLSEVYADGVLSQDELNRISHLFVGIEKEFVLKHEDAGQLEMGEGAPPVLDSMGSTPPVNSPQQPPVVNPSDQRPDRMMAENRDGIFGGLVQRMEQIKLDWAWRNRVEKFEAEEKKRKRQEYIKNIVRRIELGENISTPVGVIIGEKETVCWIEPAVLIEEVTKGSRGHRYTDKVPVDQGQFIMTTVRFIFRGRAKTFDTKIDRILGVDIAVDGFSYTIQNRSKKKMFEFPNGNGDIICAVLNHIGAR